MSFRMAASCETNRNEIHEHDIRTMHSLWTCLMVSSELWRRFFPHVARTTIWLIVFLRQPIFSLILFVYKRWSLTGKIYCSYNIDKSVCWTQSKLKGSMDENMVLISLKRLRLKCHVLYIIINIATEHSHVHWCMTIIVVGIEWQQKYCLDNQNPTKKLSAEYFVKPSSVLYLYLLRVVGTHVSLQCNLTFYEYS